MVNLQDLKVENYPYLISLVKLTGKKIADVQGYIIKEFGEPTFKITNLVMEDGSTIGVGGEHDFPYLEPYRSFPQPNMDEDTLRDLYEQMREDD